LPTAIVSRLAQVPLAAKVVAALSIALLPLGIVALLSAWNNYAALVAVNPHIGAMHALGVALPALMWLAALAIAAFALDRLVVQPLRDMRIVVERYASGNLDARMIDGEMSSPELAEVAIAFNRMADRAANDASAMESALATQKALTREVHHRVKNNLQIVSSLLSLQARDAANSEVAAAYALIRQRVNALALVHRWMYQDDGAHGVELRPLLADLSANLEHGFEGRGGGGRHVGCKAEPVSVGQDTALPIAFLVTELVAGARATTTGEAADARIAAHRIGGRAVLTVTSAAFEGADGLDGFEDSTRRILSGLARQLRSPLCYDAEAHAFRIEFPALVA